MLRLHLDFYKITIEGRRRLQLLGKQFKSSGGRDNNFPKDLLSISESES